MKKYKNGKIMEVSTEEAARIQKHFEKHKSSKQSSLIDYETKIKELEEAIAALTAQTKTE